MKLKIDSTNQQNLKVILIIFLFFAASCTPNSSPEGRMKLKTGDLQTQIDELRAQQNALADSIIVLRKELHRAK